MAKTVIHNLFGIKRVKGECVYMDAIRHEQHWAWLRKKAQAKFRGESWTLTIEEWFEVWDKSDQWDNRGRHPNSSAVFMRDPELGWHLWNVEVCNRSQRLREIHLGNPRLTGRPKKNG
jgi:hypothetical protein